MEEIYFKKLGLLVNLTPEESKTVTSMFNEGLEYEKINFSSKKTKWYPWILPFIRRVFDTNKDSRKPQIINASDIVKYLYEKIDHVDCLNVFKNLDHEAEFYGLCTSDFLKENKK